MSIIRTTQDFKAFPSNVQECTSNEVIDLDTIERSQGNAHDVRILPTNRDVERIRRARERDMALGVFCGFPYGGGVRV